MSFSALWLLSTADWALAPRHSTETPTAALPEFRNALRDNFIDISTMVHKAPFPQAPTLCSGALKLQPEELVAGFDGLVNFDRDILAGEGGRQLPVVAFQ